MENRYAICENETLEISAACNERYLPLAHPAMQSLVKSGLSFGGFGLEQGKYAIERLQPRLHVVIYTLSGEGYLNTGGVVYQLTPGDVWIAPAGISHHYGLTAAPWSISWLCFRPGNALSISPAVPVVAHAPSLIGIDHAIRILVDESDRDLPETPDLIAAYAQVLRIFCTRLTRLCGAKPDQRRQMTDKAFDAVRAEPNANWSIHRLLEVSGLSVTGDRLRQLCQQHYGQSPMRRVTAIRMQVARELLTATDYCIYIIAPMVGYDNEAAFSTAFKRETDTTPRAFRQRAITAAKDLP